MEILISAHMHLLGMSQVVSLFLFDLEKSVEEQAKMVMS